VLRVQRHEAWNVGIGQRAGAAGRHLQQALSQHGPALFQLPVVMAQRGGQFAQADRVGARHGFQQGREQVLLFVVVVVARSGVEVAQHGACRLLRGAVGAMRLHVGQQTQQGVALVLHTPVAGGQHLQGNFKADGWGAVAGQGEGHGGCARVRGGAGCRARSGCQVPRPGRWARRGAGEATLATTTAGGMRRVGTARTGGCVMSASVALSSALK
jgi:hypothetical protein